MQYGNDVTAVLFCSEQRLIKPSTMQGFQ